MCSQVLWVRKGSGRIFGLSVIHHLQECGSEMDYARINNLDILVLFALPLRLEITVNEEYCD